MEDDAAPVAAALAVGLVCAEAGPLQLVVPAGAGDRARLPVPRAPAVAAGGVQPPVYLDGGMAGQQYGRGRAADRLVAGRRRPAADLGARLRRGVRLRPVVAALRHPAVS